MTALANRVKRLERERRPMAQVTFAPLEDCSGRGQVDSPRARTTDMQRPAPATDMAQGD